jgi:hypothetical protein
MLGIEAVDQAVDLLIEAQSPVPMDLDEIHLNISLGLLFLPFPSEFSHPQHPSEY